MGTNHVYAVAGAKGGVGKTTTSLNLGASLATNGCSTVVVELDLAMANLVDFLDLDIDIGTATTLHDVLGGERDIRDAIYRTPTGLTVVPSGTDIGGYVETDLDRLPDAVETLRWHHDAVLLDTPAGLSEETVRPLQLADDALLVSTPRVSSIRNAQNTLEVADRVDTDVAGLILTKSGTGASPGAAQIAEFLGVELLGHVPEDDAVPHAQDHGRPVVSDAPNSGAAVAYDRIAERLPLDQSGETVGARGSNSASADPPSSRASKVTAREQTGRSGASDRSEAADDRYQRTESDGSASIVRSTPTGPQDSESAATNGGTSQTDGTGSGGTVAESETPEARESDVIDGSEIVQSRRSGSENSTQTPSFRERFWSFFGR